MNNKIPFWKLLLYTPFSYGIMIVKVFVALPLMIIAACNKVIDDV